MGVRGRVGAAGALFLALALAGSVLAWSHSVALEFPGVTNNQPGVVVNRLSPILSVTGGSLLTVTLTEVPVGGVNPNIGVYCPATSENHYQSAPTVGDWAWTISTGADCFVYSYSGGSFQSGMTGAGTVAFDDSGPTPTPTATPTPTPTGSASPTASPTNTPSAFCDPYCIVRPDDETLDLARQGVAAVIIGLGFITVAVFAGAIAAGTKR